MAVLIFVSFGAWLLTRVRRIRWSLSSGNPWTSHLCNQEPWRPSVILPHQRIPARHRNRPRFRLWLPESSLQLQTTYWPSSCHSDLIDLQFQSETPMAILKRFEDLAVLNGCFLLTSFYKYCFSGVVFEVRDQNCLRTLYTFAYPLLDFRFIPLLCLILVDGNFFCSSHSCRPAFYSFPSNLSTFRRAILAYWITFFW